ncbi:MAG: TonB-dependent receptor plug domain-containing protein [Bacteroidales bacterium]|nr:TonB-dependent receptor plug domain-containing protein [Bacteroidales bacterium]
MKRFFCIILLLLVVNFSFAQKYTVSGYVEDSETGERIIGANVYDKNNPINGTSTNKYGFYSLTLNNGNISLYGAFISYAPFELNFEMTKDTVINISLELDNALDEIIVNGSRNQVDDAQISVIDVSVKTIKNLPALLGEVDVLKAIQLLPGVQSGTEGTSGIYVRGGGPDQNLITLDGVPLYNVGHLFGFFSVFNGDAISDVTLIKGGFPAQYGGRLSSVIDMRMRDGNMYDFNANVSVGLLASRATIEGPIVKGKSSFIISARRSYLDLIALPVEFVVSKIQPDMGNFAAGYYFQDFNAKFNYKFSDKDRVYLSLYAGKDKAYGNFNDEYYDDVYNTQTIWKEKFDLQWGNMVSALRWNHVFTPKLFSNTSVTYTRFFYNIGESNESKFVTDSGTYKGIYKTGYNSGVNDFALNSDFDYLVSPALKFKFGGSGILHSFNPGVNATMWKDGVVDFDTIYGDNAIPAKEIAGYAVSEIRLGKFINVNLGTRYSFFQIKDTSFQAFEPRLSARILINKNMSVKLGYSQMQQYIHLLTNSMSGFPTDLWVPATKIVKPQKSIQYSAGMAFNIKNKFDLTIEGFYKEMNNLVEYKEGQSVFMSFDLYDVENNDDWEKKIQQGIGWSYGAEVLFQKNYGRLNGWLGYTLSWSNRQFENISLGRVFPYKYDRRHDISLALTYKLNDKIDFGANWVFGTGNNITLGVYKYLTEDDIQNYINALNDDFYEEMGITPRLYNTTYYGTRNNFRMPAYHRLDLGVNFHKEKKRGTRTWNISVYNAYCHMNPFYAEMWYNEEVGKNQVYVFGMFPIIPSVTYSFKFK